MPCAIRARARSTGGRLQGDGEVGIHVQDLAGDVGGGVGGQEDGASDQLVGTAEALERDAATTPGSPKNGALPSVGKNPGAITLAPMPLRPSSTAIAGMSVLRPPLEAT